MPRYSEERKNGVLGKLMPPNNQSVVLVAQAEEGVSDAALYNRSPEPEKQECPCRAKGVSVHSNVAMIGGLPYRIFGQ